MCTSTFAGAWVAGTNDVNQFIQADLLDIFVVSGVITQGRPVYDQQVTSFKVVTLIQMVSCIIVDFGVEKLYLSFCKFNF